jgi:ribose transport system permease protein
MAETLGMSVAGDDSGGRLTRGRRMLGGALGPFLALGIVVLFFGCAEFGQALWNWHFHSSDSFGAFWSDYDGRFWSIHNGRTVLAQTSTVAVAALGMTLVIIAGGIDLSAGTALALSSTVLAWCLMKEASAGLAVAAALLTGVGCGLLNGLLVSGLRIVPFIITLGTMRFFLGLSKWVANDTTVRPRAADQVPGWLPALVSTRTESSLLGVPSGVWLVLLLALLLSALLRYTVFGRHVFAVGSSEPTARLCGINVSLTKIAVYTLSGLFMGFAGMYLFARLSQGNPTSGLGLELNIIAAVVIGGGSLSGGRGSVVGTLAGAGIMAAITNGCTMLGLENRFQDMILGIIIVAAVAVDQWRQRRL